MKKVLSIILAVCMLFCVATIAVSAESSSKIDKELQEKLDTMSDDDIVVVNVGISYGIVPSEVEKMAMEECGFTELVTSEQVNEYRKVLVRIKKELQEQRRQELILKFELTEEELEGAIFPNMLKLTKARVYELAQFEETHLFYLYIDYTVKPDPDNLIEPIFLEQYDTGFDNTTYEYDEIHIEYKEDEIDWALIYVNTEILAPWNYHRIYKDRIMTYGGYVPFSFWYAVYDAEKNKFYDVFQIDMNEYQGLEELIDELKVGRPIGDADYDGELTIMDATEIQRWLAKVTDFRIGDDISQDNFATDEEIKYICDINRDGKRTVLDATAIQMKLAKVEIES